MVSSRKICREYGPALTPKAAPGLCTRVSRAHSPNTSRGTCCGTSSATASAFVAKSEMTTKTMIDQKVADSDLFLCIFFALLAREAEARVRQRIEPIEVDLLPAAVAAPERLGRAIEPAQRLIDVPEEPTLRAREEKRLLALHGVGALIRHVERVRAQIPVGRLQCRTERLAVAAKLFHDALALVEEALFEVRQSLLRHRLLFFSA